MSVCRQLPPQASNNHPQPPTNQFNSMNLNGHPPLPPNPNMHQPPSMPPNFQQQPPPFPNQQQQQPRAGVGGMPPPPNFQQQSTPNMPPFSGQPPFGGQPPPQSSQQQHNTVFDVMREKRVVQPDGWWIPEPDNSFAERIAGRKPPQERRSCIPEVMRATINACPDSSKLLKQSKLRGVIKSPS